MRGPGFNAKEAAREYGFIDEMLKLEDINKTRPEEKGKK